MQSDFSNGHIVLSPSRCHSHLRRQRGLFSTTLLKRCFQVLAKKGVVACEMGRLYNKEAVIEMLLNKDRSASPPWASHIEKLKDVVELNLTINPAYEAKRKDAVGDGMYQDKLVSRFLNILRLCFGLFSILASGTNAR